MKEEKAGIYSSSSPNELSRALRLIDVLLNGSSEEADIDIPLGGLGSYQEALEVVQNKAEIKEDWIRQARVAWLDQGLQEWEHWTANIASWTWDLVTPSMLLDPLVDEKAPRGMTYRSLKTFITPRYLGAECNDFHDRLLGMLARLLKNKSFGSWVYREMQRLIETRTGCSRKDDPHRDVTAFVLIMKNYGLTPLDKSWLTLFHTPS